MAPRTGASRPGSSSVSRACIVQAYPTIPRSDDNKDAVDPAGYAIAQTRGMSADFVLILRDRPLVNSPALEGWPRAAIRGQYRSTVPHPDHRLSSRTSVPEP